MKRVIQRVNLGTATYVYYNNLFSIPFLFPLLIIWDSQQFFELYETIKQPVIESQNFCTFNSQTVSFVCVCWKCTGTSHCRLSFCFFCCLFILDFVVLVWVSSHCGHYKRLLQLHSGFLFSISSFFSWHIVVKFSDECLRLMVYWSIVGTLNKIPLTILGILIFRNPMTFLQMLSIGIGTESHLMKWFQLILNLNNFIESNVLYAGLLSGVIYTFSRIRVSQMKDPQRTQWTNKCGTVSTRNLSNQSSRILSS